MDEVTRDVSAAWPTAAGRDFLLLENVAVSEVGWDYKRQAMIYRVEFTADRTDDWQDGNEPDHFEGNIGANIAGGRVDA